MLIKSKLMPVEKYLFKEEKSIDMTKGIAIQTILMLLVGILVVGIVVYMVYRYMFSPGLSQNECRAQLVSWCTTCKTAGWTGGFDLGSTLSTCTNNYFGSGWNSGDDCDEYGGSACTATNCANVTICPAVGIT